MKKIYPLIIGLAVIFCSFSGLQASSIDMDVAEILKNNIAASSAHETLKSTKNFSYKTGQTRVFISNESIMKIVEGVDPVVTEVTVVSSDEVRRNCFNRLSNLEGLEKNHLTCLMKLQAGLFTLEKFAEDLSFQGLKSFGPEKNFVLKTNMGDLNVEFYLNAETYLLKRMFMSSRDASGDIYEVNYDFGPFEEVQGIKIPLSWYSSQVGTRGNTTELSDISINPALPDNFYTDTTIHAGEVAVEETGLKGNIISYSFRRNALMIETNWTRECLDKAGIKEGDSLILNMAGSEVKLDYHSSSPPRSAYSAGSKLMLPNRRGENFIIYLISSEFKDISEKLELLMAIRIKKES
ncbi:MAG: hypothetical protein JXB26_18015 [Candidatus Aminicenantes bacterium]|nr:hypothetical protein [Candidatus Aminicenantes bacterium]